MHRQIFVFVHVLLFIIVVASPDGGAGNDPEAFGVVYLPLEGLKQHSLAMTKIHALGVPHLVIISNTHTSTQHYVYSSSQ